jgi:N-acetylneuraminic acid mutarotase
VEIVKRVKINATPKANGRPWGLSLAAGVAIVVMTLGSQMAIYKQPIPLVFPGETETLKAREMSVDILSAPGTSAMAGKRGDTDGAGMDQRSPQNTSLPAPAKGGGSWTQKADMPTARFIPGSAVVNGKIYVIGGAPAKYEATAVVEEYDPAADTWTRRADMPTARQWLAVAAVDGIIYAIGGSEGRPAGDRDLSTVEAYDPSTDMWTKKTDMPSARCTSAIAVVDGIIYVIGGVFATPAGYQTGDVEILSTVEAYDPATDTWTRKADMPTARLVHAACVIDGRIYVSGGVPTWSSDICLPTVEVYDPAADTWTRSSDMPWPRYGHSASVVDGKMYIIGGGDDLVVRRCLAGEITLEELSALFESVDVYDPKTDTWTKAASCPLGTMEHAAAVVDGRIYEIGGWYGSQEPVPFTIVSKVQEFTPGLPD